MKNIVITGATSSVGIALIHACIKRNDNIWAIVRKDSRNIIRIPINSKIHVVYGDIHHLDVLSEDSFPKGEVMDVFYHVAWDYTAKETRNDSILQESNICSCLEAVELCNRLGCQRFIGVGSQAEFGRIDGVITNETIPRPETAYGISKYSAGKLAFILCRKYNIDFCWGRIFSAYGIYDNENTMIMYAIRSMIQNTPTAFTKCEQMWDYIFLEDVGEAFYLIGESGINGKSYNIASGQPRRLNEFLEEIYRMIKPEKPIGIGLKEYSSNQVMNLSADISDLTKDTGFVPKISFNEGIYQTIQWYKRECKNEKN